ncbi:MAG: transcriptional regulator NrdR [Clostridia bacterium]
MKCPYCGSQDGKVLDTRTNSEGFAIKRRRECNVCVKRFTTYETIEVLPIVVVKKNGTRQAFDKAKIMVGLLRACEKRPVDIRVIEDVTEKIEQSLKSMGEKEIHSSVIGSLIMERLKQLDLIAYVRFVSVYQDFNSVDSFVRELESLINKD